MNIFNDFNRDLFYQVINVRTSNEDNLEKKTNALYDIALAFFNVNESTAICRMASGKEISLDDVFENIKFMTEYEKRFNGDEEEYTQWLESL